MTLRRLRISWGVCLLGACSDAENTVGAAGREVAGPTREAFREVRDEGIVPSAFLEEGILVVPGVFDPGEAEEYVLPLMRENPGLFRGRRVLEIGTGSGAIALYAARLGAAEVVATDIDPLALECAEENARRMGLEEALETRLVPREDLSAYAVVEPGERFDVIVSNPPYSLDLEAEENTYAVDTGDLGLSIVQGLREHLAPDGTALLLYNSLFYHMVMVEFARREGYAVRNHAPSMLTVWETQALFNSYMERLLRSQGVDPDGMRFDHREDPFLFRVRVEPEEVEPLFEGDSGRRYPGMIVIERG